jgi:Holliday junction resolvase RusA-like endonuclease
MTRTPIKPLSVNKAWKGRRFKTQDYKRYERDLLLILPSNLKVPEGELEIKLEFGFSNKASDFDNPVKPFVDILQKKYDFDDKMVYQAVIKKKIVKKGEEYIKFSISEYSDM